MTSSTTLRRQLGVGDAVVVGLGSMIGAGIFVALAPAARAAGSGLLLGLGARRGRRLLQRDLVGPAGRALPDVRRHLRLRPRAPRRVLGIPRRVRLRGRQDRVVRRDGADRRLLRLAAARPCDRGARGRRADRGQLRRRAEVGLGDARDRRGRARGTRRRRGRLPDRCRPPIRIGSPSRPPIRPASCRPPACCSSRSPGYARIATLGEEVRDPARTIRRAIPLALAITLLTYLAVAVAVLAVLGPAGLASAPAPLADAVRAAGADAMTPVVRVAATIASVGSLLALMLGVSRTTLAMARDRHLPHALAAVHPRFGVPYRAELAVGRVVAVVAAFADVRAVIGFSSFAVLVYYAIANASASTLSAAEGRPIRAIPARRLRRMRGAGARVAVAVGGRRSRCPGDRRNHFRDPRGITTSRVVRLAI